MHKCKEMSADVFKNRYGWPHDEIPLNKLRHDNCPYCGKSTEGMEPVTGRDVALLSTDPKSGGYQKRGGGSSRSDFSGELLAEIKKLRAEVKDLKADAKTDENKESDK